jgi:FtsZ-binding cell division protein ZapB
VSGKKERRSGGPAQFSVLRDRVQQATKLIRELRESNYALTDELAALKREVDALRATGQSEELDALQSERKLIREKVESLLEGLDQLES